MPTRLCSTPRCPDPATYRGRCQRHAKERNKATHTQQNKAIYNSKRWAVLRRSVLFNHPLCIECGQIATDVDHIQAIDDGGDPWSPANLQTMCSACHGRKTRQEMMSRG